eukprot:5504167-Amphidinium_carterae.1
MEPLRKRLESTQLDGFGEVSSLWRTRHTLRIWQDHPRVLRSSCPAKSSLFFKKLRRGGCSVADLPMTV